MIFKGFGYLDKENGFKKQDDFAPFPSGITIPLANYAQIDDDCIDSTITDFLQNISFILLGKNKPFYLTLLDISFFLVDLTWGGLEEPPPWKTPFWYFYEFK